MTTYYVLEYSNLAGGSFAEEGAFVTWNAAADSGFIISDVTLTSTTGRLYIAIVGSSVVPDAADTLTQGAVTADVDTSNLLLYPAYLRDDIAVASSGAITWTGPALSVSHSFFFDGQTSNVVAGEILTFSGGAQAEVITVVSDAGASGELDVRVITNIDTVGLPGDNETFTGDISGDGTVNGEMYERSYLPLNEHRFLSELQTRGTIAGDDDLSVIDPTASERSTDQIITLLGTISNSDEVTQHMFGGSIEQDAGLTRFSGLDVGVTSPNTATQPVLIQDDALITDYWKNAYNPDSIAGNVRILVKTREDGVDIDGGRIEGKLLEFGDSYFIGSTTLGLASTSLALFSSGDGNNNTAVGTVAGAPYNTVVQTEGYQLLDFGEGSGSTPFGYSLDYGTATALQAYERSKYIQRRGTAETLFGRNAQLVTGMNRNFAYDNETGTFSENEIFAWGTVVPYTGETSGPFILGEVVEDTVTGARGRIIYLDDQGTTGTLILADSTGSFGNTNALSTVRGAAETTATSGTVVNNTASGTGLLIALDDNGTTGNIYYQALTGVTPADNQQIRGRTSLATADIDAATSQESRTINTQYIGAFTGSNYQTNFGIAIDPSDAIAGDQFPNLDGTTIFPPDNRTGAVTNVLIGDYVTAFPWDGVSTDINGDALPTFAEMTLATALVAGVSTSVDVGIGNIPNNTPSAGFIRVERDSDGNLDRLQYSSFSNATGLFTLVGTAPNNAAITNTVMRGLIDQQITADGQISYTAQFAGGGEDVAITVRRGGSPDPIKTFKTQAAFGSFSVSTTRTADD